MEGSGGAVGPPVVIDALNEELADAIDVILPFAF